MADFEKAVAKTIALEGGDKFTDDPKDPGGPTRFGIAQNYHPGVNAKTLTLEAAKAIYKKEYWDLVRGDEIKDQFMAELIFDSAVNPGLGVTLRVLQASLGLPVTKSMDAATLTAVNETDPALCVANFLLGKIAHYVGAVTRDRKKETFFFGWVRRTLLDGGVK